MIPIHLAIRKKTKKPNPASRLCRNDRIRIKKINSNLKYVIIKETSNNFLELF
jgi:hypothetical protein